MRLTQFAEPIVVMGEKGQNAMDGFYFIMVLAAHAKETPAHLQHHIGLCADRTRGLGLFL
jgi:hypothetical protein